VFSFRIETIFTTHFSNSVDLLELQDIVGPLVPLVDHSPSLSTSSSKAKSNKKRKASNFAIDKDGALVLSDDSDDQGKSTAVKIARLEDEKELLKGEQVKVKKEKGSSKVKVKKEKVVIELD